MYILLSFAFKVIVNDGELNDVVDVSIGVLSFDKKDDFLEKVFLNENYILYLSSL